MRLRHKRVTVVGIGKSGMAAARFLVRRGASVRATDNRKGVEAKAVASLKRLGVQIETGGHSPAFIDGAEWVVTSPGVPPASPPLVRARRKKIPVISEIELAYRFCRGSITAVTGSNGKTTTCHLIHAMSKRAGRPSVLCGNVGDPFLGKLPRITPRTRVVLELSSFQLEQCPSFRPQIAVVLNLSANHLDRHRTMAEYTRAKERIFANQTRTDLLVLNADDAAVRRMASKARSRVVFFSKRKLREGVFLDGGVIRAVRGGKTLLEVPVESVRLKGAHNLENLMAATAASLLAGVPAAAIRRVISTFETLEHRIEPVGRLRGVSFVNDAKSTTLESTRAAIMAVPGPVVLVAGGRDKGSDFAALVPLLKSRVKSAVLYGEARDKIASSWKAFKRFKRIERFGEAVKLAFRTAAEGDTLLLSPMCTSFDQFSSYKERGAAFKRIYAQLSRES